MRAGHQIRLIEETDGWWTAIVEVKDVASLGPSHGEALENLNDGIQQREKLAEKVGEKMGETESNAP